MTLELPNIIPACHPDQLVFDYQEACCHRALVDAITNNQATVQWTEITPPGAATTTAGVSIAPGCVNCLLPPGTLPGEKWLCIGDSVLVLDSRRKTKEGVPVSNSDRFLIIGLDAKIHGNALPVCFLPSAGFAINDAKYGQPFYAEEEIYDNGQPTGLTECVPVNPDPANMVIPLGTVTNSGNILTAVANIGGVDSIVPIKPFMIPNFYQMRAYCNGPYRLREKSGYLYAVEPAISVRPWEQWEKKPLVGMYQDYDHTLDVGYGIHLLCPRTAITTDMFGKGDSIGLTLSVVQSSYDVGALENSGNAQTTINGLFNWLGRGFSWELAPGAGHEIADATFIGDNDSLKVMDLFLTTTIAPTFNLDGSVSFSTSTTERQDPAQGTTSITYDHTYTYSHGMPLVPGQDGYGQYTYVSEEYLFESSQSTTDTLIDTKTLRDYNGMVSTVEVTVARQQDRYWIDHFSYNFVTSATSVAPTTIREDSTYDMTLSASAVYKVNDVAIGETSIIGTRKADSTSDIQDIAIKGCAVVGSCGEARTIAILHWQWSATEVTTSGITPTISFTLKLLDLILLTTHVLETWSYTSTTANLGFLEFTHFSTAGVNVGRAKAYPSWAIEAPYMPDEPMPEGYYWSHPLLLDGREWWSNNIAGEWTGADVTHVPPHFSFHDVSWSDSNICTYEFGVSPVFISPGKKNVLVHDTPDDVWAHLVSRLGLPENVSAGGADALTGLPATTYYDPSTGKCSLPVSIVMGKDGRQMMVEYLFDGTTKTKWYMDFVEFDMNAVKQM